MNFLYLRKKGQALVEAVAAFGIAAVALLALVQLANRSVGNSGEAGRQAVATNYATDAMQWVKYQKSFLGWEVFKDQCSTSAWPCTHDGISLNDNPLVDDSWGHSATEISGTEYNRRLRLEGATVSGKEQITATVTVSWYEDGRQVHALQTYVFVNR